MVSKNDKGEIKMRFSFSRVECFNNCPYRYKLRYIEKLKTLDEFEPQDPLRLGTALHTGIEKDTDIAIHEYFRSYPIINDLHINESIKLETMLKKAREVLPLEKALFEVELVDKNFRGFIDMLSPNEDGSYDMYDFKYSNNIDKYMESAQLSIYKYFAEKLLGINIRKMHFVFVQKVMIRQKKTENLLQFRKRLKDTLADAQVQIKEVSYDANKVIEFVNDNVNILTCNNYYKNKTKLCDFCEYKSYCENQEDLNMLLPSTSRVTVQQSSKKKVWVYGVPFSGKTTFADGSPTPLNLNTDGNVKYVTMPRINLKDEVTVSETGRSTKRKFVWEFFKEVVDELEKGSEFETIVIDLLEDIYDACRIKVCDDNGWGHESDDSFKAYDIVRSDFLRTMKRLLNLDYNIILISHEDTSKDITKKGGDKITSIQPNINDKVAKKLSGMVDLVGRVEADGNKRTLNFKSDDIIFGGGRLQGVKTTEIPLSWDALCKVFEEAIGKIAEAPVEVKEEDATTGVEKTNVEVVEEEKPVRRTRRTRE